ncbi:carbohydrate kinase family protein [Bradyrhizobium jicamae]|uniref:carbohydrate kinase family protein n=1 Tax=Bradyrhizobium jicamae TaxID=280332 RepID=UPI002012DEA1|nr:carbohydrate kinase family protein [Bradyrhizobium jicamae]
MAARKGVLTAGTWCCDHNKLVDHWPSEDGLAVIISEERRGGGSACNMAIDLKKLDSDFLVETIGIVGDDDDGQLLLSEADAHGIERGRLRVASGMRTSYTDSFSSRATGRRTHLFFAGAGDLLNPDLFDFSGTRASHLHLGLPGIHPGMDAPFAAEDNGWVAVLKKARAAGLRTNMELVSAAPDTISRLIRPCLPLLDFLIINDVEVGALAGMATESEGRTNLAACRQAARKVMDAGAMELLVVHFPLGAIALTRSGEMLSKPSVRVPAGEIAGANGAGDAFAAGMLYAVLEGWTLADALTLAHAAAAASLRRVGTTDGVLHWRECLALAERWGWRQDVG